MLAGCFSSPPKSYFDIIKNLEKAEYQNRTGDERLETFSFASKLIPQSGSGGTRTPDQFIRSELLYPSELLTHVVVPIAANPELPRGLPQLITIINVTIILVFRDFVK